MTYRGIRKWFLLVAFTALLVFGWRSLRQTNSVVQSAPPAVTAVAPVGQGNAVALGATNHLPSVAVLPGQTPAAVKDFRAWAMVYLSASPTERRALEAQGVALAKAHTLAIAELIRKDPQQAIASAVPMVIRQDLPPAITAHLEKRERLKASLNVYGNVPAEPGAAGRDFEPYTRSVTTPEGEYWNAYVYGRRAGQRTLTLASINGISVGRDLAIADSPVRQLEVGERPVPAGREVVEVCPVSGKTTAVERTSSGDLPAVAPETPAYETAERVVFVCSGGHISQVIEQLTEEEYRQHWEAQGVVLNAGAGSGSGPSPVGTIPGGWTTGQRKFLYIRATFPDHLIDPQSEAECHDSLRQMADYITQASYGRCYFTYAVAPLVVLPYPESWYVRYQADGGGADTLIQSQARTIAKALGYDYLNYDLDAVRWNGSVGNYGGSASVGARGMRLKTSSVGTFCHELGHNLGVWHANYWRTTPPSFIGPGNNLEYGNIFDLMGSSGSLGQYTAHFKNILNWLPDETHWNVTSSGLYRIHQFDYAVANPDYRYALRIRKDAERDYWAEFRQRFTTTVGLMNGLMITWDGRGQGNIGGSGGSPPDGSNKGAQLLDMTPGSFGNGITDTRNDSALWIGRTYSDPDANIHITPIAKNLNTTPPSMDVYVSVDAAPSNQPPTLAISASTNAVAVNGSITLTAAAIDPDGDALAYAWVFGDGSYSTNNNAVQTKSWSSAGRYHVLCTASDMKGKRTTRSLVITVGNPTTFTVSGNITGPDAQPLEGVYVANYAPSSDTSHPNSATFKGTWTDSDGNYTLAGLAAGSYTITPALYPNVFAPAGVTNLVTVGPSVTNLNFTSSVLPTITLNVTDAIANEGAVPGTGTIRIERSGSTNNALDVQVFNASSGTATRNVDYTLSPALIASTNGGGSGASLFRIPAGAAYLDVTVTPINDSTAEGTEYAVLDFANTSGGYVLAGTVAATVAIVDDENPTLPVVKMILLDKFASETDPDTATFQLQRFGATNNNLTVNLSYSGSATSGIDFTAPASVVIPAGSSNINFTLTPIDDTAQEGTEFATVTITANAAYARDTLANSQTAIITDNDLSTVSIVATTATTSETPGTPGAFTIARAGGDPQQSLTVDYALAGRAVHGIDYRRLDGRAVIPAGVMSTRVEIWPIDDTVDEGTQDVICMLRSSTNYIVGGTGTATVNITDNDASQVYVKLTASAGTEPASGSATAITFQIIRPASGSAITVNYAISGTATSGTDFTALPGTIAFASADTTKSINVLALADTLLEDAETVTLTLLPGTGYTLLASQPNSATGFILDGDQPTVSVSVADTSSSFTTTGTETSTGSALRFIVARKVATTSDLVVNYTMSGTATEGVDYTGTTGSVTIASNTTSAYVAITAVNDTLPEGVESIIMNLTPSPGIYGLQMGSATMLLGDNDPFATGTVGFLSPSSGVFETNGVFDVPVRITGAPTNDVSVSYRVSGGTATGSGYDFNLADGTLTFPLGTTNLNIPVGIILDDIPEPAESITLQLFNAVGANLGTSSHTITITNLSLPEAFTDAATNVLASGVTFRGRVIPNGQPTDAWFQYGPTAAFGSNSPVQALGSGSAAVNVTAALSGIAPGSWHFRCVASNSLGVTYGADQLVPSRNAGLSNIVLSAGTLAPSFATTITNYTLFVGNPITNLIETPIASDPAASVRVNSFFVPLGGSSPLINLALGTNLITTTVISPDNLLTNIYTVAALRMTAYQTWAYGKGLVGTNSAAGDDYDGDGKVNLLEYAINTDPLVPNFEPVLSGASALQPDTKIYLTLTHRRRIAPGTLNYSYQTTTDLSAWADVPGAQIEQLSAVPVGDGTTETATLKILPPIEAATSTRFFRLKVSE